MIRLVERGAEPDYVRFKAGGGCPTHQGRIGGEQLVELHETCDALLRRRVHACQTMRRGPGRTPGTRCGWIGGPGLIRVEQEALVPVGTNNSGLFYFFEPGNWEMLIKVLDGCAINDHHWVYAASATDQGLDITVTDTMTGETWTHSKAPGPPASAITESNAFNCGP